MKRSLRILGFLALALALPACGIGGSGTLTPTVAPQVPQNLTAKAGNHSVTLSWLGSPAATSYTVKRSTVSGGPYAALPGSPVGTTFVDPGLVNHTPFYYVVSASNAFGESSDSAEIRGIAALRIAKLSGGVHHSAFLLQDGSVWTCGQNGAGQLGNGLGSDINVPVRAIGLPEIAAISANGGYNLAMDTAGLLWSWGENNHGQLGNGPAVGNSSTPTPVLTSSGMPPCAQISGGWSHALVLARDGTVWSWGLNDNGQLGLAVPGGVTGTPVQVPLPPTIPGVLAVSSEGAGSMVLSTDGTVWCWGNNEWGQLGDPAVVAISSMTPVQVFHLAGVVAISCGNGFCIALRQDGTVWSWGLNDYGTLGDGFGDGFTNNPGLHRPQAAPVLVNTSGGPQPLSGIVAIDCQSGHSLALRSDGTVWAWGANLGGEIGDPAIQRYSPYAVQVSGLSTQAQIAAGSGFSLTAAADGTVWGWGDNADGKLATGTHLKQGVAIQFPNLTAVTAVAAGGSPDPIDRPFGGLIKYGSGHCLSLSTTGQVWTWGNNAEEQLGTMIFNGTYALPQLVVNTVTSTPLNGVTAIAAGGRHGLAISGANAWSWGDNSGGQLGQGFGPGGSVARAIRVEEKSTAMPLPNVIAVAAGEKHSLAIQSNNTVWAWGDNTSRQLGNGTAVANELRAVQVLTAAATPLTNVIAISAGFSHSLALRDDNTVWAWGDNTFGQLGNGGVGSFSAYAVQVKVLSAPPLANLTGIVSISAGSWHSLARTTTGAVWSWGDDTYAQLGRDPSITQVYNAKTFLNTTLPNHPTGFRFVTAAVPVVDGAGVPLTAVTAVAAGDFHSLALRNDLNDLTQLSVWAWGDGTTGQLGNQDAIIFSPPPGFPYNDEFIVPFSPVPIPVQYSVPTGLASLRGITAISCSGYYTLLRSKDGTVWGCGNNNFSQLGSTTIDVVTLPVTIDP